MIFGPFGAKKNLKNWIWKMTLADPPSQYGIFHNIFFFYPYLSAYKPQNTKCILSFSRKVDEINAEEEIREAFKVFDSVSYSNKI